MRARTCLFRLMLGIGVASLVVGTASAQTAQPQSATGPAAAITSARVPAGDVVFLTDSTGTILKGRLAALSADAVEVRVNAGVRRIAATDIRRIQWQKRDSAWTGAWIGAAIGAIPGIYWLIADPNECTGLCPEEYAMIAAGAAIGGLIDCAITRKVTVYSAESPRGSGVSVAVVPLAARRRIGVQVGLRF